MQNLLAAPISTDKRQTQKKPKGGEESKICEVENGNKVSKNTGGSLGNLNSGRWKIWGLGLSQ